LRIGRLGSIRIPKPGHRRPGEPRTIGELEVRDGIEIRVRYRIEEHLVANLGCLAFRRQQCASRSHGAPERYRLRLRAGWYRDSAPGHIRRRRPLRHRPAQWVRAIPKTPKRLNMLHNHLGHRPMIRYCIRASLQTAAASRAKIPTHLLPSNGVAPRAWSLWCHKFQREFIKTGP
jgi:hypothetical protein